MLSDPELLRRYAEDSSQEAFAELVQRHIDFVYAAALRQAGSNARAEDVTQAVFTDLAKKAAQLATRNDLVGWLHTSTHYAATSIRRSEARREAREIKAHMIEELASTQEENANWQELRPILDEALHSLSQRDREAILLRYFKQRSFEEIGTALGQSEEASRKRVDRGVAKLRTLLSKRGITSTLVALELAMASQAAVAAPAGLAVTVTTSALAAASAQVTTLLAQLLSGLKTIAVAAAVMIAFVSGGLVVNSTSTARDAEQTLAAEKQRLAAQQKQYGQLANRLAEIETLRTAQQRTLAELKATVAAKINRLNPKFSGEKFIDTLLQLDLDAEMQKFMHTIWRCMCSSQHFYGPLFNSLRLSPEQVERFAEICESAAPSVPACKFTDTGNGRGTCTFSMKANLKNETVDENALRQLLGDDGIQAYKEHDKTMFIQMLVVNKLASNLVYSDAPLNAATAKLVTRILANATPDPDNPLVAEINWGKALKDAKAVLTATQLSALARLSGTLSTSWSYEF